MDLQQQQASPQRVAIAERRIIALALRKQGGSYRQIAEQMRRMEGISPKYSEAQAHNDVRGALRELITRMDEAAEEVRRLELERLDELLSAYWHRAKTDPQAAQLVLSIMGKLEVLRGLPTDKRHVELSGKDGGALVWKVVYDTTEDDSPSQSEPPSAPEGIHSE